VSYHLRQLRLNIPVCTLVTQVVVSKDDPDFDDPTKPVGPFYTKEEALKLRKEKNYIVKEVKPGSEKGWRRVVPSPEPIDIVEKESINDLIKGGVIVIASGGGGIPVMRNQDHDYLGIEAVIDKDRAGFKLAQAVGADYFLILTDVDKACLNYRKAGQKALDTVRVEDAEKYLQEGHFLMGSMGPKVQAAIRFVRWSGKEAIITSLDKALDALHGKTGTHIVP
jgi:carbamate kinase